ncbi:MULTISPECIES: hypothetical protein [Pseudomonas]|uniref:DUF4145 domain-containing protein n=1 Tax=Pseudomonas putida TaxID=303 RepID=A0A3M8SRC2_PSEPU|nr:MULTISPECIES: hypothetical protein [Pseudomonas]MCE0850372.1 hypothetical protein [Pseudomonas asiatica]MCO6691820.1 hypothetical protein [Pseudomonas shirazica]RNF81754.1 hypothetical protein EFK07_25625 [Pseudomonas putida]
MDWLQFFSSVLSSLAWPVAVIWLAYLLRAPLRKLIPRVRTVKYGEFHVDIGEQLEEVKEKVDAAASKPAETPEDPPISFRALAKADPRAAILSAWIPVEVELNAIAKKNDAKFVIGKPALRQLQALLEKGVLDQLTVETIANLRRIRNSAVHVTEESVSFDDAMAMAEMCQWVTAQLKRINNGD